ncbi:uncharacterized protein DFL_003345 [Arthrobotrys flagrans]|uniref:Ribosomal RNA-processing protein 14/surfeit locus protein 6 C-terminal domain-containing protein n=1 Tax=Arthrobotrys flagrans TaxID=97331 RepID=A0A437A1J3_ARTFL|nr:hypothetical protein DFL_003345 [Arthrobotrys flagrans]
MSEKDIEDRLIKHARAFDSLLNLIPAKMYFTQDNSDQWKKRKQTKEESQAAKRAKLDPDQAVTVKEVEDERARERAAREEKRRKLNEDGLPYETKSQMKARRKEERRRERRQNKEADGGKRNKDGEKKVHAESQEDDEDDVMVEVEEEKPTPKKASHPPKSPAKQSTSPKKEQHHPAKRKDAKPNGVQLKVDGTEKTGKVSIIQKPTAEPSDSSDDDDEGEEEEVEGGDITAEMDKTAQDPSDSEASDSEGETIQRIPGLAAEPTATASSPSPAPSNTTDTSTTQKTLAEKLKTSKDPLIQQQLKERLAKRIEELRHARKADGGEVPRTRTELMEQRRKRDEQRKERKKQMRLQAKVLAEKAAESTDGKRSESKKNSGVSTAPANYTFGNVNFEDGDKLTADLEGVKAAGKKRGPSDVLGALKHAEAKKARLAGMSEDKRADIQEKDRWSKALKMASGEKLQDDEGLLKKSLKRQEKAKKKSEREWKERNDNVEKGKMMRQKKREANLAARREQKKAGKGGKKARKVPSKKSKGRAGFEGTGFGGAGKKKK